MNRNDLINILRCTTQSNKHQFKFETYPNLRGLKYVSEGKLDAYYPIYVRKINQQSSLWPIYIDEILLISKKEHSNKKGSLSVGIIRGANTAQFENSSYKFDYIVNSPKSLFKGLRSKRINHILIFRSQIPSKVDLSKYTIKTIIFQDVGIQINKGLQKKVSKTRKQLQKKFIQCILNYEFILTKKRKLKFHKAMRSDIMFIQNHLGMKKVKIDTVDKKELAWKNKNSEFIKTILNNNLTKKLQKLSLKYSYINEAFVFNHQGALVSSLKLTSDYDQSDEKKYTIIKDENKFNEDNISHIYFDESAHSFQIGITIRLNNKKGEFAGGLYLGADINKFITYYKLQ